MHHHTKFGYNYASLYQVWLQKYNSSEDSVWTNINWSFESWSTVQISNSEDTLTYDDLPPN